MGLDLYFWQFIKLFVKNKDLTPVNLVCGEKDDDCYECTRRFTDLLDSKKISYGLKIFQGLDHEYPDNFNEILQNAIEFTSKN